MTVIPLQHGDEDFQLSESKHYAELWMGTHPSGPSRLMNEDGTGGELLKDFLKVRQAARQALDSSAAVRI